MTNTARHGLGALIGVIVTPVAWLLVAYAGEPLLRNLQLFVTRVTITGTILPMLAMIVAGALLGLLATTFVSPVGAVVAGAVYLLAGLAYPVLFHQMFEVTSWLPGRLALQASNGGFNGMYLVAGALLLMSAIPPNRWRPAQPTR
ncbi:MAG TPA: hypothetical protein VGL93_01660 [Streptosporangiaceae bacterium]|jgi:hypothetical protein